MKKICVFFALSFCVFNLYAQKTPDYKISQNESTIRDVVRGEMPGETFTLLYKTSNVIYDSRYEGLKGTPYLFNKWQDGVLFLRDGNNRIAPIKYNSYDKRVEIKQAGDSISIHPYQIKGFKINDPFNDSELVFLKVENFKTNIGILPVTFLMVIYNNKIGFYKHFNKDILKADYKDAYSAGRTFDSFQDNSEYFIRRKNNSFVKVKLNKKSVILAMIDKEEEISSFLKHREIKNEKDIIDTIQYYENL